MLPLFSTEREKKKSCYTFTVNKVNLRSEGNLHSDSCLQSWNPGSHCADNPEHLDGPGSLLFSEQQKTNKKPPNNCFSFNKTIFWVSPQGHLDYIKNIIFINTGFNLIPSSYPFPQKLGRIFSSPWKLHRRAILFPSQHHLDIKLKMSRGHEESCSRPASGWGRLMVICILIKIQYASKR